jgi:sodium transport system permease protein
MERAMNTVLIVARKELVDLFRDRKTVMIGMLMMPLLFPALILGIGSLAERRTRTQLESTMQLPIIGAEHAPNLVRYLHAQNIEAQPPPGDPDGEVRAQKHDVVLRIPPGFGDAWRASRSAQVELIYDSSRQESRIPVSRVRGAIDRYNGTLAALRSMDRGLSPEVLQPVRVSQRDVATPESRRGMLLSFLPYLLILSSFLGGAYLIIDVTAGERERQSLEPLLATPAARTAIMSGKILAAICFGMISLLLILAAFKVSFAVAPGPLRMVKLSWPVLVQLMAVLLPMVLTSTTLLTLISASVKSVKEAQSYMSVLMLLPIVPTAMLMVSPIKNQLWQFAVPFLAQNQLILRLVRGEPIALAEWTVYIATSLAIGVVLWILAARLYHKEKLAISA